MDSRERFRRLMAGQTVDRLPVMALEPLEDAAIGRWRTEGLPSGVDCVEYLGMSRLISIPLDSSPIPGYPQGAVSEDEEYVFEHGFMGGMVRRRKDNPKLFYGHVNYPVKTRADWEEYTHRFALSLPDRLPPEG